jgi:hypothetical protein
MYPLQCAGGYNVPAKAGKFRIVGFTVAVDDTGASAEVAIIDDPNIKSGNAGFIIPDLDLPTTVRHILVHKKKVFDTDGNYDATIEWFPPEPLMVRYGTSLFFSNIKQGSFCLYVR